MDILTVLILLIQEHEISFHFFESPSVCFINVLYFSACFILFTSLVRYILKYFLYSCKRNFIQLKKFPFLVFHCSVQFSSVAQSCPTPCDPMHRSTPGHTVHHQLLEFTQTYIHRVSGAIQPSHPLSSPSPPAPNPSQHQSLFQ